MGEPSDESSSSHLYRDKGGLNTRDHIAPGHRPLSINHQEHDSSAQDYFDLSPTYNRASSTRNDTHNRVRPATSPHILPKDHVGNHRDVLNNISQKSSNGTTSASAASPFDNEKAQGEKSTSLGQSGSGGDVVIPVAASSEEKIPKPPLPTRMKNGSIRFLKHTKDALFRTYFNILLVFVPAGIAVKAVGASPAIVFAMNAVAIIPLAGLLTHATESVASRLGDTWGALLNVSFGNAVELIIFIIALVKNEIRIVQASLLGSILANLLLILGMAFLAGGLRFQEQSYNSTVTQMSACLLSLSVMSLLLPTAFHASFSDTATADLSTLKISRGTSVVLLLIYILYLVFQLKSHAYLYESMPQAQIDAETQPGPLHEVFDSSTSSSSSDSSGSDTDTTSGSHTTAKRRIKKFIRRTRRKSSSNSQDTGSVPSFHGASPIGEGVFSLDHGNGNPSIPSSVKGQSRRGSHHDIALEDIASGDEGDVETRRRVSAAPKIKDFQTGETSLSPERLKSLARKERKHRRHHRHRKPKSLFSKDGKEVKSAENEKNMLAEQANIEQQPKPTVNFVEGQDDTGAINLEDMKRSDSQPGRRPFNLRTISTAAKPDLRRYITQSVFASGPPTLQPHQSSLGIRMPINGANVAAAAAASSQRPVVRTVPTTTLRRTSSLPDRLNQGIKHTSSEGQADARRPLPPYVMRVPPETVLATDAEELEQPHMSRTSAVVMLLISTALVAICAEFLVDAIPAMTESSAVSQAFIGLIILPIVGNAAEHVTAVTVAAKNKMDLAIGVAVGSSIQIALFVTPVVVLLGWILDRNMSLYFNLFETVSLFVTVFVVNFLVLDGKSNYLEGTLLIAAYIIIAVAAFFYPDTLNQSELGGSGEAGVSAAVVNVAKRMFF